MINKYLQYISYVLNHKKYVFQAGRLLNVPIINLIFHDWDKFLPSMIYSYANYFYGKNKSEWKIHQPGKNNIFDLNWLQHLHRNKHHWQHWILQNDSDGIKVLEMPDNDIREMVADWKGAGMAQNNKPIEDWYAENKNKIILGEQTRKRVEFYIDLLGQYKRLNLI